jgi:tetratricopeptide (TPR) repeat protein
MITTLFRGQPVSDEFTEVIHRETDGNPFFIEEVVKALVEQGQIYWAEDHWEREELDQLAIPQSIKEAIGRRLSGLSQPCVETLHIAAVIGKDFAYSLLQSVSGESEELLLDILDEASSAQLIRQHGAESFVFTHDKIREVLYDEILSVRRSRLHLKIAQSLEALKLGQQVKQAEEIAYHYIAAGVLDKGMDYALQAATKAQQLFAGDEAIEYLRQALECAVSLEEPASQASILESLGDVYSAIGPFDVAVDYYQQAARLSYERKIAISIKIGMVLTTTNDEAGIPILEEALAELEPQNDPALVARALSSLGRFHHYRCEYSAAIELFEQARELAEPIGDIFSLSFIYAYLAGAYQHLAEFEQSLAWANRDIQLGESNNFPYAIAVGYEFIAENNLIMGYWDRAREAARNDLQIANRIGAAARTAWSRWAIGYALFGKGKLLEAVAELEQAADYAITIGENRLVILCYAALSTTYADMGNELAIEYADRAVERSTKMVELFQLGNSLQIKGYACLQLGYPEKALEAIKTSRELLDNTESRDVALYRLPYHAEGLLLLGKSEAAFDMLSTSLKLAQDVGAPHYEAVTHRVYGLFYLGQGNTIEAVKALNRAINIAGEIGSKVELGRSTYTMAVANFRDDDLEAARTNASRAITIFTESNANRELAKTLKLMEQLDDRQH